MKADEPKLGAEPMTCFHLFLNDDPTCQIGTENGKCEKEICYTLQPVLNKFGIS